MPDFKMTFPCKGPRVEGTDEEGHPVAKLYRIENKFTMDDDSLVYAVMYYEENPRKVYPSPIAVIKNSYPEEAKAWEDKYGKRWNQLYKEKGNPWTLDGDTTVHDGEDTPPDAESEPENYTEETDSEQESDDKQESDDEERPEENPLEGPSHPIDDISDGEQDVRPRRRYRTTRPNRRISTKPKIQLPEIPSDPIEDDEEELPRKGLSSKKQQKAISSRDSMRQEISTSRSDMPPPSRGPQRYGASGSSKPRNPFPPRRVTRSNTLDSNSSENTGDDFDHMGQSQAGFAESQRDLLEIINLVDDDDEDVQRTQVLLPDGKSVYEEYSARLIEAHDESINMLVKTAMELTGMPCDRWVEKRKVSEIYEYKDLKYTLWVMMLTWDPLILKHFVHGNIPEEEFRNQELKKALKALKNLPSKTHCPSTYVQYLVDDKGKSPSPKELLKILDNAELYLRGLDSGYDQQSSDIAYSIDNKLQSNKWSLQIARQGKRRYIEGPAQGNKCKKWIKACRERLRTLPLDEPLARPFSEVGFATFPVDRLDQHSKHSSSNYLMNLTDAICMMSFPKLKIKQFVVHHLIHPTHAMYDEILASRISLAYTPQGGGWSHCAAGISHAGSDKTSSDYYRQLCEKVMNDPAFIERSESEIQKFHDKTNLINELIRLRKEKDEATLRRVEAGKRLETKIEEVKAKINAGLEPNEQAILNFIEGIGELRERLRTV